MCARASAYAVPAADLRLAAHKIADAIYERLTGDKGVFATRIAYITKGGGKYPIPVMLLARLGVDKEFQGIRLGSALLKDAILRTIQAADIGGLKLLIVHAKDDSARAFYERHGFQPSLLDPLKMFLPMALAKQP